MQPPADPLHEDYRGVPEGVGLGGGRHERDTREGLGEGNTGGSRSGY
jgi:hypothetical protein